MKNDDISSENKFRLYKISQILLVNFAEYKKIAKTSRISPTKNFATDLIVNFVLTWRAGQP